MELYQPGFRARQAGKPIKSLIVEPVYARQYKPEASGGREGYVRYHEATMAALLVPCELRSCLHYTACGRLDLGRTLLNVLRALGPDQSACEVGGHTFGISMEMLLAAEEK